MDELQLISRQEPGLVSIDNFAEMKEALSSHLDNEESVCGDLCRMLEHQDF